MKIENEEELQAVAEALENDEDVALFIKVSKGQKKLEVLNKIHKQLDEKIVKEN